MARSASRSARRPGRRTRGEVPASAVAPRAMLAGFVTTLVSTTVGAGVVGAYLDLTDPHPSTRGLHLGDLLRALGVGALAGLIAGVVIMVLAAWLAMMLHVQLRRGRGRLRVLSLLLSTGLWALGVWLGLDLIGFSGLGSPAYAVASPALVVAWVMVWFLAPWVVAEPDGD